MHCLFVRADYQQPQTSGNSTFSQHGAPGEHWGQCFGLRSLQFCFQHLLSPFLRLKQRLKNINPRSLNSTLTHNMYIPTDNIQDVCTCKDGHNIHICAHWHRQKHKHILLLICVNCHLVELIIVPFLLSPAQVRPRGLIGISFSNYYSIGSFSSSVYWRCTQVGVAALGVFSYLFLF